MMPPKSAEAEHHEGKADRKDHRTFPGKRRDPSEHAASAAQAARDLERGRDREDGEKGRSGHESGQQNLDELGAVPMLRIHQQVMHADRQAVDQEQNEGQAAHRVAVEPSARRARGDAYRTRYRPVSARNRRWRVASMKKVCATGRHRWSERVRVRRGSPGTGARTATPTVVQSHMTAFATVANMASGTGRPGLSTFHACIATSISTHQTHDAATTRTSPT